MLKTDPRINICTYIYKLQYLKGVTSKQKTILIRFNSLVVLEKLTMMGKTILSFFPTIQIEKIYKYYYYLIHNNFYVLTEIFRNQVVGRCC